MSTELVDPAKAWKFGTGRNGGLPPQKEGQEIDLTVAHWCLWGPRHSGLYETTRELIQAEMEIEGVLPGMCLVPSFNAPQSVKDSYVEGRYKDVLHPELNPQNWGWALKHADVHVIHFSMDGRLSSLSPKVFFSHGTPSAVVAASLRKDDDSKSFQAGAEWVDRFEASIVTSEKALRFWKVFDRTGEKVFKVNKGIDLDWWQRGNTRRTLHGEPSVLYGETWRDIKHPLDLLYAMNQLYEANPKIRLNAWGLDQNINFWQDLIQRSQFDRFMGEFPVPSTTDYPEHYYNHGDVLVSPVKDGDLSRVHQEALACGCPVVAWESDPFHENPCYKYAKPFSIDHLADQIMATVSDLRDDSEQVHKECRRIAEAKFDIREEARSVVRILRRVVSEQRR